MKQAIKSSYCNISAICMLVILFFTATIASKAQSNQQSAPILAVVLCDVSTSVSSGKNDVSQNTNNPNIGIIKEDCRKILETYPPNSKIVFLTVSQNAVSHPFLTATLEPKYQRTERKVKNQLKAYEDRINTYLDSIAKNPESVSCILTSIQLSYNILADHANDQSHYNKKLIILSDLVEECPKSPCGKGIWMKIDGKKPFLSNDQQKTLTAYKPQYSTPSYDFGAINASVEIHLVSPGFGPDILSNLVSIWRTILTSYGFKTLPNPLYIVD